MRPVLALLTACACATTVTEQDSTGARIRYDIGIASLNQGDLRSALRELLAAVEVDPTLPEAYHGLGLVYHALGRHQDAVVNYRRALELRPNFSEARNNFGVLLLDLGRYDEAIVEFKHALADILYATPSLAEGNLGWTHYKQGNVDAALLHLRNAVAINPRFCRGYGWLAQIELGRGRADQVVAYCKRFEKHCVDNEAVAASVPPAFRQEMHYYLAMGLSKIGDETAARAAFTACAELDVDSKVKARCQAALVGRD